MARLSSLVVLAALLLVAASTTVPVLGAFSAGFKAQLNSGVLQPDAAGHGLLQTHAEVSVVATNADLLAACSVHGCTIGELQDLQSELKNAGSVMCKPAQLRIAAWTQARADHALDNTKPAPGPQPEMVPIADMTTRVQAVVAANHDYSAAVVAPNTQDPTTSFTYTLGRGGEVLSVTGFVRTGAGTNPKVGTFCHDWYRMAMGHASLGPQKQRTKLVTLTDGPDAGKVKQVQKKSGAWMIEASNTAADIDDGHIVAAGVGGRNDITLNFFPQTGTSNRDPLGTFQVAETLAMTKYKGCPAKSNSVKITVTFTYANPARGAQSISTAGTYVVDFDDGCNTVPHVANWKSQSLPWTNVVPNHHLPKFNTDAITIAMAATKNYILV